jgi:Zn-dependent membrane protease YugP
MNDIINYISKELGGASPALTAAYLVVGVLIMIMSVVCLVLEIRVWLCYRKANKRGISTNMTGIESARYVLDQAGLTQVKVRKAGFIREAIFGNYYNVVTKTIYLRSWLGKIDNKTSVTSTALGVQKAAIARLCEEGDEQAKMRGKLSLLGIFGPLLFIPIILIGMIIDYLVMKDITIISYASMAFSGLLLVAGFIVTWLNIPVEKRANALALRMMRDYGLANEDELEMMAEVYDAYILSYIAQFILEVLRVVQWILEIIIRMQNKNSD